MLSAGVLVYLQGAFWVVWQQLFLDLFGTAPREGRVTFFRIFSHGASPGHVRQREHMEAVKSTM